MDKYSVSKTEDGVMYFDKEHIDQVKIRGIIRGVELRHDSKGKPFYSVYILHEGDDDSTKWNCFILEKVDGLKIGDKIVGHGIFYGINKRLLKHIKVVEPAKTVLKPPMGD